ncbi:sensor histidine kinase [Microbacterium aurantiacum]|uniref:sensor histidine kinase n=1 Tax=Microbacterium aurantiacum TaxID=162393 RepID=UPI000C7FB8EB|nr:sensor histidine kinase [Microbacterium aurantiacum]
MAKRRQRTRRSPRITRRSAIALLCGALLALFAVLVPIQTALYGTPLPLAFILGAALCSAPLLALSRPRTAIAQFCAAAFALPLFVVPELAVASPWPWSVPALITFVLFVGVVTFVHGSRLGVFPLAIGVLSSLTAPLLRAEIVMTAGAASSATADMIVTASLAVAMYLIAVLVAARARVGAELNREREHSALEEARRALMEERTRIARELHDVIAHSMSVIQVQASTARYRLPSLDQEVAAEFEDIAATARGSLTEMRRMLGVLRTEDQTAELAPQQGIDDIPALVDSIRRAGVEVGLEIITGDAPSVAPGVQIAAFRIVQEALSNAVRHAPETMISVRVRVDAAAVHIAVQNSAPATTTLEQAPGHGLRGMRERAQLLGGTFGAGPVADGGWAVEAVLPLITHKENP